MSSQRMSFQQLPERYQQRFAGSARVYGQSALLHFYQAHIAVIGLGGVGSWAVEALARTGIGQLTIIDMDDICVSNTNRQLHTVSETIGQSKTEVMAQRVQSINPDIQLNAIDDFITADNLTDCLTVGIDYVIDAIDSVAAKTALLAYCRRHKIAVITIGGAGGKCDPGQIQISDLAKTIQDPLLAKVRERLKRDFAIQKNSKGKLAIECVYSTEPLRYPQADGSTCGTKKNAQGSKRLDCASGLGAAMVVTSSFALIAVAQVLKKLLHKKTAQLAAD